MNPAVTVVTLNGLSVTMETDPPWFAVQIRAPSKDIPEGSIPESAGQRRDRTRRLGWVDLIKCSGVCVPSHEYQSLCCQHAKGTSRPGPGLQQLPVTRSHARDCAATLIRHPEVCPV